MYTQITPCGVISGLTTVRKGLLVFGWVVPFFYHFILFLRNSLATCWKRWCPTTIKVLAPDISIGVMTVSESTHWHTYKPVGSGWGYPLLLSRPHKHKSKMLSGEDLKNPYDRPTSFRLSAVTWVLC